MFVTRCSLKQKLEELCGDFTKEKFSLGQLIKLKKGLVHTVIKGFQDGLIELYLDLKTTFYSNDLMIAIIH